MRNKSPLDKDLGKHKVEGIKDHCAVYLSHQSNLKDVGIAMVITTYEGAVKCLTSGVASCPVENRYYS